MSHDRQPAPAGTGNEADSADPTQLPRRRLLQALGGAAGVASVGLSENGPIEPARAQSDGSDDWTQQQKLFSDDGDISENFGSAVSVSADGATALIGASGHNTQNGQAAGAAYVFSRSDDQWSQQQKLTPDDGDRNDRFGRVVSVSGDGTTAVVGAPRDEDPNGRRAGSAYVFARSNGQWPQQQKLTTADGDGGDGFGSAVSVSGDGTTAVISAPGDEDPNGDNAGSAYVFDRSGGQWPQQQKLTPTDGDDQDIFGGGGAVSVSGEGTTALTGARFDANPNGDNAGSAYVFEASGTEGGGGGSGDPVDEYDEDDDGQIDNRELLDALADYDGDAPREEASVNNRELLELLAAYTPQ